MAGLIEREARRIAKRLGVEIEAERPALHRRTREELDGMVTLSAPHGSIFSGSFCHQVCCLWLFGSSREEAFEGAVIDLKDGIEPCDIENCEECDSEFDR